MPPASRLISRRLRKVSPNHESSIPAGRTSAKPPLSEKNEFRLYEAALILRLDTEAGTCNLELEYKSPPEVCASEEASHVFKAAARVGDKLYTCTSTEAVIFEVPSFKQIGYVSLPCFNDLHHIAPMSDGSLLVASTGLDMVVRFTLGGEVLDQWNVLGGDPWGRFSRDVDYRRIESTKPHQSHPNHVFQLGEEIWVTRFSQRDAICLSNREKRIAIDVQRPHDGLVYGDHIYFTTVDGKIVIADRNRLQVVQVVDLTEIHAALNPSDNLLGWCRGILPLDERREAETQSAGPRQLALLHASNGHVERRADSELIQDRHRDFTIICIPVIERDYYRAFGQSLPVLETFDQLIQADRMVITAKHLHLGAECGNRMNNAPKGVCVRRGSGITE